MAFQLKTATAFAQGAWNIYILQPEWLLGEGVLPRDRTTKVQTSTSGPAIRIKSGSGKKLLYLTATPFVVRVEADPRSGDDDVGAVLANLIEKLPHTPI